jgi:hypothetical protein
MPTCQNYRTKHMRYAIMRARDAANSSACETSPSPAILGCGGGGGGRADPGIARAPPAAAPAAPAADADGFVREDWSAAAPFQEGYVKAESGTEPFGTAPAPAPGPEPVPVPVPVPVPAPAPVPDPVLEPGPDPEPAAAPAILVLDPATIFGTNCRLCFRSGGAPLATSLLAAFPAALRPAGA